MEKTQSKEREYVRKGLKSHTIKCVGMYNIKEDIMCNFFSLVSDGAGKMFYFDYSIRKKILSGELEYELDSHSSIADYHGFKGKDKDMLNKYEYNPLTKEFVIDSVPNKNDSELIKEICMKLDFKTIVPELVIKSIVHPFRVVAGEVTGKEIESLKKWDSVRYSVWDSVWASVGDSVGYSVGASVWDSVGDSVWDSVRYSVWDSVWASVGDSVGASVGYSVGDSVGASVRAYISSFFNLDRWKYIDHEEGNNPFQSCIDLWNSGFVPSYDGTTWRLHAGTDAKIVYKTV